MSKNKSIKIIPFPNIKGAYVVISFREVKEPASHTESCLSFIYDRENGIMAEWEPKYGPITTIQKCEKDHPEAKAHWYFEFCTGYGNWSQLAVEERGLPEALYRGDYEYIFEVLKTF